MISAQAKLIVELEERIRLLENGRKSTTSHTPSSRVKGRSNSKGLREKSDKSIGGQIGHECNKLLCKSISDYKKPCKQVVAIQKRLEKLLMKHDNASPNKKVQAFIKLLEKKQKSIFTFLCHHYVPPDNNASERAKRNVIVKTKLSGQYKSQRGAVRFAILRSVINTIGKAIITSLKYSYLSVTIALSSINGLTKYNLVQLNNIKINAKKIGF